MISHVSKKILKLRFGKLNKKTVAATVLLGCAAGTASAGGLYIPEESSASNVSYGGIAFHARANDASTVFANPAGMTRFDKAETFAGGSLLYLKANFTNADDSTISGTSGRATEFVPLGNAAYLRPINDKLSFGLSAHNNFGLLLNWGSGWTGRYVVNQAIVLAPQIQPTLAYKLSDSWSVGAGLGLTFGYLKDKKSIASPNPGNGKFRYSDTDFAVQPNVGFMFEPSKESRFGVRYLVETDLDFRDDPSVNLADGSDSGNNDSLSLGIVMPQQVELSGWQRVSEKWAVLADVNWEDWSRFGEINIAVSETNIDQTVRLPTEDTWHIGLGAEYQASEKLMYTMGASWDSSWQRDANRTAMIPIGTVWRIGGGFKYKKSDDFTWGSGVSIFYEGDLPIAPVDNPIEGRFSGQYSNVYLLWLSLYGQWR
jgi:long-chain fatty acid transport protein